MLKNKTASQSLTLIITIAVLAAVVTSYIVWHFMNLCIILERECDLTNWQTLLVEGIVIAGGLGYIFYRFQRKSSQKIQDAVNRLDQYTTLVKTKQELSIKYSLDWVTNYLHNSKRHIEFIQEATLAKKHEVIAIQLIAFRNEPEYFRDADFRQKMLIELENVRSMPFDIENYEVIKLAFDFIEMLEQNYSQVNDKESLENWLIDADLTLEAIDDALQIISSELETKQ